MADSVHHTAGEVEPGVTLADLTTPEACDATLDRLVAAIASIEQQLAQPPGYYLNRDEGWRGRAKSALRHRKMMVPRLQARRAEIVRQERQARQDAAKAALMAVVKDKRRILLGLAYDLERDAMARVEAIARERHPDLFLFEEKAA